MTKSVRNVQMLVLLPLMAVAPVAQASDAVERALEDLKQCTSIEEPICQAAPGRIAAWGSEAVPRVMAVFTSLPAAGQLLAVGALSRIDEPASTDALISLAKWPTPAIRAVVLESLGPRFGIPVEKVLVLGLSAKEPSVRAAAAEALGKSGSSRDAKRVVPALTHVCADTSEQVAVAAIESLGVLGDPLAVPSLLGALRSPRLSVRRAALYSARMIRDPRFVTPLILLLDDVDGGTASEAATVLGHLTGRHFGTDAKVWHDWWIEVHGKLDTAEE